MNLIKGVIACTDYNKEDKNIEISVFEKAGFDISWYNCQDEDQIIKNCRGYKVLINQSALITDKILKELPDLKVIVRFGVGVDNIDLKAATKHGVKVCNVPDYGTAEVADHAVALSMALARKIVLNSNLVKKGEWLFAPSVPIHRFSSQTVGVIGLGRIGLSYAKRMHGLGFNVVGYNNAPVNLAGDLSFVKQISFDELIKTSDIISIHCPLDGNRDLIDKKIMEEMKPTSMLINVSRGGIINEEDLYLALKNGVIASAACDVTSKEPIEKDSRLLTLDNFICTPHIAWYSEESAFELRVKVAEEAVRGAKGIPLANVVNG